MFTYICWGYKFSFWVQNLAELIFIWASSNFDINISSTYILDDEFIIVFFLVYLMKTQLLPIPLKIYAGTNCHLKMKTKIIFQNIPISLSKVAANQVLRMYLVQKS